MKQSLIDRVLKEGSVRTNRFEYKLVGNTIMKRNIEQKGYRQWQVAKVIK